MNARGGPASLRSVLAPDPARFVAGALVAAATVAALAGAAATVRILPLLLDPDVPGRAARPLLAGVAALALEIGALVGWPLGWVEVAIRSRERGEARARMALGESPLRRLLRLWPAFAFLAVLGASGSIAWGRDARAPGRVARALVAEGRVRCEDLARRGRDPVVAVPLVRVSWLCSAGRTPLLVGEGSGGAAALDFAASALWIGDDLTSFSATDAQILVPASTPTRVVVGEVRLHGLHPFSAPSSVSPWARAGAIVSAALLSAILATVSALRGEAPARASAWAIALAGPAATLVVLRAMEQAAVGDLRLLAVPGAAVAATLLARGAAVSLVALRTASQRRARPR